MFTKYLILLKILKPELIRSHNCRGRSFQVQGTGSLCERLLETGANSNHPPGRLATHSGRMDRGWRGR